MKSSININSLHSSSSPTNRRTARYARKKLLIDENDLVVSRLAVSWWMSKWVDNRLVGLHPIRGGQRWPHYRLSDVVGRAVNMQHVLGVPTLAIGRMVARKCAAVSYQI